MGQFGALLKQTKPLLRQRGSFGANRVSCGAKRASFRAHQCSSCKSCLFWGKKGLFWAYQVSLGGNSGLSWGDLGLPWALLPPPARPFGATPKGGAAAGAGPTATVHLNGGRGVGARPRPRGAPGLRPAVPASPSPCGPRAGLRWSRAERSARGVGGAQNGGGAEGRLWEPRRERPDLRLNPVPGGSHEEKRG